MSPNQAIFTDKIICSSSTRRRSPVDRSLVAKALNPSLFRHACRMAISRNACSLLDFPEFAQAVRYGVPGTGAPVRSGLMSCGAVLPEEGFDVMLERFLASIIDVSDKIEHPSTFIGGC